MTPEILVAPGSEWAAVAAERLAARLRDDPALRVCVPSGSTPTPFYAELARLANAEPGLLGSATLVLLDEYVGLPPGDPARCESQVQRDLLSQLERPPGAFIPIAVDELAPADAARRHDAAGEGLDIAIVGLGQNGHVGLNEPGSLADSPTRVVDLTPASMEVAVDSYGASSRPRQGVTLGMDRVLGAGEVWLLVTGEAKAEILRRALEEPESADVPASFLRRHPGYVVIADEAAAARLSRG